VRLVHHQRMEVWSRYRKITGCATLQLGETDTLHCTNAALHSTAVPTVGIGGQPHIRTHTQPVLQVSLAERERGRPYILADSDKDGTPPLSFSLILHVNCIYETISVLSFENYLFLFWKTKSPFVLGKRYNGTLLGSQSGSYFAFVMQKDGACGLVYW
jgi:hypothetical protein